eukprot:8674518-Lingulodinium_polyedra.AAC.1
MSCAGLISEALEANLDIAETAPTINPMATLPPEFAQQARTLYHLLVQLCPKGRAASSIMSVERHNGFRAWKALVPEYEPKLAGRHANMLAALIAPEWKEGPDFREQLQAWEIALERYERQSGEKLSPALKVAVVSRYAPK